jgi:Ca-activated chloride channel homolog
MNPFSPEYDVMLQRAMDHYRRGEFDKALELLEVLEASGHSTPEARELLSEIALQQKLTTREVSFREPPEPYKPIWPIAAIASAVVLLLVGAGLLAWLRPWESAAVASAPTLEPTAVPTVEPTAIPTVEPTAVPSPTTAPTARPVAAPTVAPETTQSNGLLAVRLPAGQDAIIRTPRNIAIIFDASGSMNAEVGDQLKIAIARDALSSTIDSLPEDTFLAIRTYGNQRPSDCSDLSLLRPLGLHDRAELLSSVGAIEPAVRGMTPIGASLDALAADIAEAEGYTAVLLISDGGETCDGDPVASAQKLVESNPNLRINVIGFDIGDEAATSTLREIARVGGGNYFDAGDASALATSLQEAVKLSYRVVSDSGTTVTGLVGGAAIQLPAGSYRVLLDIEGAPEVPAEVTGGGETFLELTADGNGLALATP